MRVSKLRLKYNKSEGLVVGPNSILASGCGLTLNGEELSQNDRGRSLGILLDPVLLLDKQVAARSAFYQLCPTLPLATVTPTLVPLKLNYCNTLYTGAPLETTLAECRYTR